MRHMKSLGPLDLGILGCLDLLVLDDLLLLMIASIGHFDLVILVKPNNLCCEAGDWHPDSLLMLSVSSSLCKCQNLRQKWH